jgi:hypothetical protein
MIAVWHVAEPIARVRLERFTAAIDPLHPGAGLHDVEIEGVPLPEFNALGVQLPGIAPETVESYTRAGDLIVTYAAVPAPQMRTQLYWRSLAHERRGAVAALVLVASVQTDLLDSRASLVVGTQLVASEVYQLTDPASGKFTSIVPPSGSPEAAESPDWPRCYLCRLPGRKYSYAEMVPSGEEGRSHWEGWLHGADYRLQLRHELFARPLEKGVILRARVLGVLLERENDRRAATEHWAALLADELPLTA